MTEPGGEGGPQSGDGRPDSERGVTPSLVLTVVIDQSAWLQGAVTEGAGPPARFEGWVGLMAVIDRLRLGAAPEA